MSGLCMCWVIGGGGSVARWLPAGGIHVCASKGTCSSFILGAASGDRTMTSQFQSPMLYHYATVLPTSLLW